MKLAISAQHNNLDAAVDRKFGRSTYFLIVDTDTLNFDSVSIPNNVHTKDNEVYNAQLFCKKK